MQPILFDCFPKTSALPLAGIAELPTRLDTVQVAASVAPLPRLMVKRDDDTSPFYGGNKVRKLDFLLGQAVAEKRRAVLTFGAYGSNHALATAVHARRLGLEPHVVLSPQEPGPFAPRTLLAHAGLGTVIHLVDGWDGRREAVAAIRALRECDDQEPFVIPMGGTCALGAVGYVNAAMEVVEQGDGGRPDVVYVASGTLGTAVGLALGFAAAGAPARVEAIRVTPLEICNEQIAEKLASETSSLLNSLDPAFPTFGMPELNMTLRHEFFEPGYGVVTAETTEAVAVAKHAGIALETTYTGKAFSAMLADARSGALDGMRVLFLDTYNSAPYPEPGDESRLPDVLRAYIESCRREYPGA